MSVSRPSNFSKADELLAKQWTKAEVAKWRVQNKYTWHELKDGKNMQLVSGSINSKFGHLGGVSEVK
ncbi:HNH endonuclease [Paenibacillus sp. IHBB 10380]|uniref:HNH endonuclease n=1 Tax=Paenibacillus sp. IHBB 10380 TaxID=1566358 RepID=UPI0005CFEA35|nr:HNH endonuclease [Paenibacillus sp. IHBB 10380]